MDAKYVTRISDNTVTVGPRWHRLGEITRRTLAEYFAMAVCGEAVEIIDGRYRQGDWTRRGSSRFRGEAVVVKTESDREKPTQADKAAAAAIFNDAREWYFFSKKAVADDELESCLIWEYARESAFIRDTVQCSRELRKAGADRNNPASVENRHRIQLIHDAMGPNAYVVLLGQMLRPGRGVACHELHRRRRGHRQFSYALAVARQR